MMGERGVVCRGNGTDRVVGVSFLLRSDAAVVGDVIDKISEFLGISFQSNVESSSTAQEVGHEVEGGR